MSNGVSDARHYRRLFVQKPYTNAIILQTILYDVKVSITLFHICLIFLNALSDIDYYS